MDRSRFSSRSRGFERPLREVVGQDDKIAVLKYDSKVETLVDFNQSHKLLGRVFDQLATPEFSEANFYDALLETLNRIREVTGRKAILAITSGLDTFSKSNFQQVLQAAQSSSTPIYTTGLVRVIQREAAVQGDKAPFARIDWNGAEKQLEMLAKASGGRAYVIESNAEIPTIFDDIMENLRLRYVITHVSSNAAASGPPRKIRGEPLKFRDSSGEPITAKVFVPGSYSPAAASTG